MNAASDFLVRSFEEWDLLGPRWGKPSFARDAKHPRPQAPHSL
jgi:hypothetical protein